MSGELVVIDKSRPSVQCTEYEALNKTLEWCKDEENYNGWIKKVYAPVIKESRKKFGISVPFNFIPRWYQISTVEAMLRMRFVIFCMHRRSGKDYMSISMLLYKAMEKVGNYYYLFPKAKQGRKIIWEGLDDDGKRFRDHIPNKLIKINHRSKEVMINNTEMMITLVNGSTIQIVGSDNYDNTIVGTNVAGVIFSEFALSDPMAWSYCRPILSANKGWSWINSTPRAKNHFWKMLDGALWNDKLKEMWFGIVVKNSQTGVHSQDEIEMMKAEGESEQMIAQELECEFEGVLDGVIYASQIIDARADKRITEFMIDRKLPVFLCFDIGIDMIAVCFVQIIRSKPTVIDFYGVKGGSAGHIKIICDEFSQIYGYDYKGIFLPHDAKKRSIVNYDANGQPLTTEDTFRFEFHGVHLDTINRCQNINEDIEICRGKFHNWQFNTSSTSDKARKERCDYFMNAISSYAYPKASRLGIEATKPMHNWASHPADAFRTAIHAHALGYMNEHAQSWLCDLDKQIEENNTIEIEASLI